MKDVVEFEGLSQEGIKTDLRSMLQGAIRASLEMMLEEEMKTLVGAERYERAVGRKVHRNGSYLRGLLTSMGHIEVSVPRSRDGSPGNVLGRYQRRMEDVDDMITESYVQGVSQRKMGDVTQALLGEEVKRSTVSRVAKRLEQGVEELRSAPITQAFPYLYLDATFIGARWARSVENVAALVAYGVGLDGHRHLLGVTIGAQESEESWSVLLEQLVKRGLTGVQLVISDDHAGLKKACRVMLPEARHQRCVVHFLRNAMSTMPRRLQKRVIRDVSKIFKSSTKGEAETMRDDFITIWSKELPETVECLINGFDACTQFFHFPPGHHKRLRTTNSIERLNLEIKRRVKSVGAFPDRSSALRLITAVAIKTCEIWGDRRYLDMKLMEKTKEENRAA